MNADLQRRARMRQALERLKQAMAAGPGDKLSWLEQPWGFELYVNSIWDSDLRLHELEALEAAVPAGGC